MIFFSMYNRYDLYLRLKEIEMRRQTQELIDVIAELPFDGLLR